MKYIVLLILILNSFFYASDEEQNQLDSSQQLNKIDPSSKNVQNQPEININNSFITKNEYGKMLYNNPRGIGCNTCHGNNARGKKIVDFKQETKDKRVYNCSLIAPDIKDMDYQTFSTKINSKKNPNMKFEKEQVCEKLIYYANVMPTYFLVEDEIEAIYYYIQNLK